MVVEQGKKKKKGKFRSRKVRQNEKYGFEKFFAQIINNYFYDFRMFLKFISQSNIIYYKIMIDMRANLTLSILRIHDPRSWKGYSGRFRVLASKD